MEPLPVLVYVSRVFFLSPPRGWLFIIFLCGPAELAAKMAMSIQMLSNKGRSGGDTCPGLQYHGIARGETSTQNQSR